MYTLSHTHIDKHTHANIYVHCPSRTHTRKYTNTHRLDELGWVYQTRECDHNWAAITILACM